MMKTNEENPLEVWHIATKNRSLKSIAQEVCKKARASVNEEWKKKVKKLKERLDECEGGLSFGMEQIIDEVFGGSE